jgi:hypothetical protein
VYVADTENHRIQKFTSDGVFLTTWGRLGSNAGEFARPHDVACDTEGRIFVADTENPRIQVFTNDGFYVTGWGSQGEGDGQFRRPHGVAVEPSGRVLVADTYNNRIQEFQPDGSFSTKLGDLGYPKDIVVDASGKAFVSNGLGVFSLQPESNCLKPPPTPRPKILLHISWPTSKGACDLGRLPSCGNAVVSAGLSGPSGSFYYVYLLVEADQLPHVGGVQCGITYESGDPKDVANGKGIDIFDWTSCGTLEFVTAGPPAWPEPGGGNLISWASHECPLSSMAVAGYFYVGASRPIGFKSYRGPWTDRKVADCDGKEWPVSAGLLGYASFSPGAEIEGCNPCLDDCQSGSGSSSGVPIRTTTWSRIKTLQVNRPR